MLASLAVAHRLLYRGTMIYRLRQLDWLYIWFLVLMTWTVILFIANVATGFGSDAGSVLFIAAWMVWGWFFYQGYSEDY